jgi:hypothetical protein
MTDTLKHIESMQHTARELEALGRRIGFYSKDCDTLDNAVKAGRSGFVVILDESGEVAEIHAIGKESAEIGIEKTKPGNWDITLPSGNAYSVISPYEQVGPGAFEKAAAQGHEPGKKNPGGPPIVNEGKKQLTGDALRAKQVADSARERTIRAEGIARNERIAAQMKAQTEKLWGKRSA